MRGDITNRVTLAICLGLALIGSFLYYLLLSFILGVLLSGPPGTTDKDVVDPMFLIGSCVILGTLTTTLLFNPIRSTIGEYGLPGFIPAPDPLDGKSIRLSLSLPDRESYTGWKEHFNLWIAAPAMKQFMTGQRRSITLRNNEGSYLTLSSANTEPQAKKPESFTIRFSRGRRVIAKLESSPIHRGEFQSDSERRNAQCSYSLIFVGCEESETGGWIIFWGTDRTMRLIFFGS